MNHGRRRKKTLSRGLSLARQRWVRFQGRHNRFDHQALEECVLCDGDGCKSCKYSGVIIAEWHDIDDLPARGIHPSTGVHDSNGNPCEGRFKGWDGKRKSLA